MSSSEGKSTIAPALEARYRFEPVSTSTIDVAALPPNAQKILDPNGPAPLKVMAAKGLAPGLKPGETLAVICALSLGTRRARRCRAEDARERFPLPLLNGALAGDVQSGVLDVIGPIYAKDANLSEKILHHPSILAETVAAMAASMHGGRRRAHRDERRAAPHESADHREALSQQEHADVDRGPHPRARGP